MFKIHVKVGKYTAFFRFLTPWMINKSITMWHAPLFTSRSAMLAWLGGPVTDTLCRRSSVSRLSQSSCYLLTNVSTCSINVESDSDLWLYTVNGIQTNTLIKEVKVSIGSMYTVWKTTLWCNLWFIRDLGVSDYCITVVLLLCHQNI